MKQCTKCQIKKEEDEFYRRKNGYIRPECKKCTIAAHKARPYNKEKQREYRLKYQAKTGNLRSKIRYKKDKEEIRKRTEIYRMSLNGKIKAYKKSAKARSIPFILSDEQCENFYKKKCGYCGDVMITLGIDRIDNTIGYEYDNCIPCCSKCNFMKHVLTLSEFKEHINKIYKNLNL